MPWKTEIDRLVHHLVLDAAHGGTGDVKRATRAIGDLLDLAPDRAASQFHAGGLDEVLAGREIDDEEVTELIEALPEPGDDTAARWRHIGRLDGASRAGQRDRVHALMEETPFEESLDHSEGRMALRAVGRMLLREGKGDHAFALYQRHLAAVEEDGSRRDAEFLLEESLRRADRGDADEAETLERLGRAADFAAEAGLEARACSKVDRKLGRMHQLAGRTEDATACYRQALDRLPEEDPYRSVLLGDLALATLGVRGTLDLLPQQDRERREEAEKILESGEGGEGRSYNAIYTRGMLAYERTDWEPASTYFREADRLMRENRAKARIVHARSRFFLAHCLLELGAEGEELTEAERAVRKNASAVALDVDIKGVVFDALVERVPDVRLPGRQGQRGSRGSRGRREEPVRISATQLLEDARKQLEADPHATLDLVDRAFKSRPDFEVWYGAYTTRLDALLAIEEGQEAARTWERFRAKLYQRDALDRIETLLEDADGPVYALLDDVERRHELIDLYEAMPDREAEFLEACECCAKEHLASGAPERLARAVALFRELTTRDPSALGDVLVEATAAAKEAGVLSDDVPRAEIADLLKEEEDPVRLVVVGGDKGRKAHLEKFEAMAADLGFEGDWIFTGVRPPYKTLREVAGAAQDADVILLHHTVGTDMRREVMGLGEKFDVPVREAPWLGTSAVEPEVLRSLRDAFVD